MVNYLIFFFANVHPSVYEWRSIWRHKNSEIFVIITVLNMTHIREKQMIQFKNISSTLSVEFFVLFCFFFFGGSEGASLLMNRVFPLCAKLLRSGWRQRIVISYHFVFSLHSCIYIYAVMRSVYICESYVFFFSHLFI